MYTNYKYDSVPVSYDRLVQLLAELSHDPDNYELNYFVALEYEGMGQYAAAESFFLRCADRTHNPQLAYECMLKIGLCLDRQGRRNNSVRGYFQHAICLMPKRPEAYFLLARHYERIQDHPTGYMYADLGLKVSDTTAAGPLLTWVEYPGKYGLLFEKAVCAWWWGKPDESRSIFLDLWNNYAMDEIHTNAVENNMKSLGVQYTPKPSITLEPFEVKQQMPSENKMDIVLQGPYADETDEVISNYLKLPFVNNIIVSCWEDDKTPEWKDSRVIIKKNKKPMFFGTDNRNLQIVTSRAGVAISKTRYVGKMRTDQLYDEKSMWNMYNFFMNSKDRDTKIFVAGYFPKLQYHPRDHIFWGLRQNLESLFDCPLEIGLADRVHIPKDKLWKYYNHFTRSETYICANYIAKHNPDVLMHLIYPEKYLFDNAPQWAEAHDVSTIWTFRCFKSFPREGIDLKWRRKGWEHYPYDLQYGEGERWSEYDPPDDIDFGDNDEIFKRFAHEEIVLNRQYEKFYRVADDSVVVDIGANVGLFPITLADRKLKHYYGVEPAPNLVAALRRNLSNKVTFPTTVCEYAIGAFNGEADQWNNEPLFRYVYGAKPNTMKVRTFKEFVTENDIKYIDFLKMDAEGAEYDIFTTENYEFLNNNVGLIVGEWHLSQINNSTEMVDKFIQFKDEYLVGRQKPYRVFEAHSWKDVSQQILDNNYVWGFYNWWHPRQMGAQLIVYLDNR